MADCKRKTANLFNSSLTQGVWAGNAGEPPYVSPSVRRICTSNIINLDSTKTYTVAPRQSGMYVVVKILDSNGNIVSDSGWKSSVTFSNAYGIVATFRSPNESDISPQDFMGAMLNEGSTPLPYEPYGWVHSLRKLTTATDTFTTLPAVLYPNDTTATVGLKGNTVQNGTPSSSNPIEINGVGERTTNLLDKTEFTGVSATIEQIEDGIRIITPSGGFAARIILDVLQNTNYTVSYIWKRISGNSTNTVRVFAGTGTSTEIAVFEYKTGGTFNTGNNTKINIWFYAYAVPGTTATVEYTKIMLNTGSTPLPYEPYGIKIPISSAGQTTPVYLGEVETTRRVKKQVVTISRIIESGTPNMKIAVVALDTSLVSPRTALSTVVPYGNASTPETFYYVNANNIGMVGAVGDTDEQITAKYEGSILYYGIAETTGIVNEPLMKIGDYADTVSGITIPTITGGDTFDVETTLKPSEVTLSYTGWHDATVKEWDGSQWNE